MIFYTILVLCTIECAQVVDLCKEKGHLWKYHQYIITPNNKPHRWWVDGDTAVYEVEFDPNIRSYKCLRCDTLIFERQEKLFNLLILINLLI